ncbi:MAG: AbrB/MazE/SpoVT family DNA-binding domain-containing protein [Bifidobacteriaceae bacterium]|jgi:antitoxin component of MazEF toxin-antitoxin module|nr:AbrB/MazE/SpoVT family DNA-binding domain-containing protein [Bifidobacteriaceae bacterium]
MHYFRSAELEVADVPVLTVTSRGQVTLRRELLNHMGVQPGDRIDVEMLPGGQLGLTAERRTGSIDDFVGCLAGKTAKKLSIEEIDQLTHDGWAAR